MGLLDEAIRDHLELKRRHGADPSEVAEAEHEALDPVFPGEESQDADGLAEETVEMDMEAFLAADAKLETQHASEPVRAPLTTEMEDESLEWELPDHATAEPPPDPLPGQEHLPFE